MTFELQAKAAGMTAVPPEFLAALPYLATILVLALISSRQVGRRRRAGLPRTSVQADRLTNREHKRMTHLSRRTLLKAGGAAAALPLLGGRAFAQEPLKVGFVYLGPIGDFGWTYAHEQGRQQAIAEFGDKIATTIVENVAEGPDSERVIKNLADDGHQMIFTTSFGYMNPTAKVAKRYPDVKFEHCSGYTTAPNMAAYNARFYEGRAVCGTLAGHAVEDRDGGLHRLLPDPRGGDGHQRLHPRRAQGEPGVQDQRRLGLVVVRPGQGGRRGQGPRRPGRRRPRPAHRQRRR